MSTPRRIRQLLRRSEPDSETYAQTFPEGFEDIDNPAVDTLKVRGPVNLRNIIRRERGPQVSNLNPREAVLPVKAQFHLQALRQLEGPYGMLSPKTRHRMTIEEQTAVEASDKGHSEIYNQGPEFAQRVAARRKLRARLKQDYLDTARYTNREAMIEAGKEENYTTFYVELIEDTFPRDFLARFSQEAIYNTAHRLYMTGVQDFPKERILELLIQEEEEHQRESS